jgi:D-beta-D-heptose 7-phosphate kinase/D-beta-D-heptose 1-phosphate adenosyltransferase
VDWTQPEPQLARILETGEAPRILVVGDLILDRYVFGGVSRVSPEAPVPVLREERTEERPGGAGNVIGNLLGLGSDVRGVGVVGDDGEGALLSSLLGGSTEAIRDPSRPTTVKTRAIARGQQVLRVDRERSDPIPEDVERKVSDAISRSIDGCRAILVSDYDKGVCTPAVLRAILPRARPMGIQVIVDPKGRDFSRYRGASVLTPNLPEAEAALGVSYGDGDVFREAAWACLEDLGLDGLVVTRGAAGITLYEAGRKETPIPARARAVYDVTGAGDTVAAAVAFASARGASLADATAFANVAAGVVVGKVGAVPVTRLEVLVALGGRTGGKVVDRDGLRLILEQKRAEGKRIVFTNGCFDILHIGHLRLLRHARSLGDLLVLGLNTDASVQMGKGADRPVFPEEERAEMVASLDCVDHVTLFDEETPATLIGIVRPDVLVKGADYEGELVVGRDLVESYGGEVVLTPIVQGISTSRIIGRIREVGAPPLGSEA